MPFFSEAIAFSGRRLWQKQTEFFCVPSEELKPLPVCFTKIESDESRMVRLRENIGLLGTASVVPVLADIGTFGEPGSFDAVLLDAPCSSLGVIRRNPDVKYRHTAESLRLFGERQLRLLSHVAILLRKGGTLVYSVCSTEPEETTSVIAAFLHNRKDFYIINTVRDVPLPDPYRSTIETLVSPEGFMFLYPHMHRTDGLFCARMSTR